MRTEARAPGLHAALLAALALSAGCEGMPMDDTPRDGGRAVPPPDAAGDAGAIDEPRDASADGAIERVDAGPLAAEVTPLPGGGCVPMGADDDGMVAWSDARCLARGTRVEGTVLRHFDYVAGSEARHAPGSTQREGVGYVVSHFADTAWVSDGTEGESGWIARGPHHAIWEAHFDVPASRLGLASGALRVTVQWSFATGRDHPVYAITYDCSELGPDAYRGDARSPYGDLYPSGDRSDVIDGVGWGDRHRFETLGEPLTKLNGWDYREENVVPYAMLWTSAGDAEIGLVQTEPQSRHAAGGYWFYGSGGTRDDDGPMPEDWNWPYQLNQYSFSAGSTTSSPRVAWGMSYGAVGQRVYAAYGDDPGAPPAGSPRGYPYQSYSTALVLGRRSERVVDAAVAQMEIASRTSVRALVGEIVGEAPAGVGRDDLVALEPRGWDARHAVWRVRAESGVADVVFDVPEGSALEAPVLVVEGRDTVPAEVRVAGVARSLGEEVLASVVAGELWLTLRERWRGEVRVELR